MMSLTETSLISVAKTQYRYKAKANAGMFITLIAAQLLAALITYSSGVMSTGIGGPSITYTVKHMSGDMIIIFTLIWAFVIGIIIATNGFKMDFTFVSNRLSSNLSGAAFLLTAAAVGGLTATLCGMTLRVILYYTHADVITDAGFWVASSVLAGGIFASVLYVLLLSSIGYFSGMLVQWNRAFIVLLPGLIFGILFVEARSTGQAKTLIAAIEFFTKESSLALLAAKAIVISMLLLACAALLSNRMEVRK